MVPYDIFFYRYGSLLYFFIATVPYHIFSIAMVPYYIFFYRDGSLSF